MNKIQEILQQFWPEYLKVHAPSYQQAKTVNALLECKTAALGGHKFVCDKCAETLITYNSCCNRHCPSCQGIDQAIWVDARNQDVVDAPYFHVVFTVPKELHMLIYQNQSQLYDLMYKTVSKTLLELCLNPKHLGATPGFFSILHTWSQDLIFHPHIHVVIMAGGLTPHNQWRQSRENFFIPVKVLAKKFRGKFLDCLKKCYQEDKLTFHGSIKDCQQAEQFKSLLNECYGREWYVYTKQSFSGPLVVIKYLGSYTHRIAISNHRIIAVTQSGVTFKVKDRSNGNMTKTITLTGVEFVRRFLMHILPRGFVKIRYYGVLANRNKKTRLARCKKLTRTKNYLARFTGLSKIEVLSIIYNRDLRLCSKCKIGYLQLILKYYPGTFP